METLLYTVQEKFSQLRSFGTNRLDAASGPMAGECAQVAAGAAAAEGGAGLQEKQGCQTAS